MCTLGLLEITMNPLKSFQNTVILVMMVTAPPFGLASWFLSSVFAKGFLLGVAAGGFWFAVKLTVGRKLIDRGGHSISLFFLGGFFPMVIWAVSLYAAYFLDTAKMHGCFGVLAGLLLVQAVIIVIGITGLDLLGNASMKVPSPEDTGEVRF